jgi:hypothetical protein
LSCHPEAFASYCTRSPDDPITRLLLMAVEPL